MFNTKKIQVLDCTIRDGGLVNNWDFSIDFVRDLYHYLNAAGVDVMEIGYKNSPKLVSTKGVGPWRFLDDHFLKEVIPNKQQTKLSAIVDIGRVDENDIFPCEESHLDMIRIACYLKDIDKAIKLNHTFKALGYETSVNIMAVSNAMEHDLSEALVKLNESSVDIAYIVDSYGSLYPRDITYLADKFSRQCPNKKLGIHAHNNLQLAYSNTLTAIEKGIHYLDCSVFGMGRAAGNCPTELLLGYLKDPQYEVKPIFEAIEKLMIPLRKEVEWGYIIPYTITGQLNEHPRSAMALRHSENKDRYKDFYDQLTTVETALE
ncbi:aldolase catalytic domain-containing protein [Terrilactibacillus laevilacticus]|uniref:aldolase catalytic domain-containing protein n=1 Tax=Terrilactibacillus laevilacticus TaxID=1380157 RepID=UPI0011463193|nr:aldolase catalytic domain-containing protein [Terrilactibacillus laevilacticus]